MRSYGVRNTNYSFELELVNNLLRITVINVDKFKEKTLGYIKLYFREYKAYSTGSRIKIKTYTWTFNELLSLIELWLPCPLRSRSRSLLR